MFGNRVLQIGVHHSHDALTLLAESEVVVEPGATPTRRRASRGRSVRATRRRAARRRRAGRAAVRRQLAVRAARRATARRCGRSPRRRSRRTARSSTATRDLCHAASTRRSSTTRRSRTCRRRCRPCSTARAACARTSPTSPPAACARSGLAARYVSGYIETDPPPRRDRLRRRRRVPRLVLGVGARSRAGSTSTRRTTSCPTHRHVTVAWGRDYGDVAPVRGVVIGPAVEQTLSVEVDVAPSAPGCTSSRPSVSIVRIRRPRVGNVVRTADPNMFEPCPPTAPRHEAVRRRHGGDRGVLRVRRACSSRSCRRFIEDELGAGELGVGLSVAAFAAAAILVRPVIARLDRRATGRRSVMIGGALLAGVAGVADARRSTRSPPLLALRGVAGIGEAALFVGAATLIADLAPPAPAGRGGELLLRRRVRRPRRRPDHRRGRARRRSLPPGVRRRRRLHRARRGAVVRRARTGSTDAARRDAARRRAARARGSSTRRPSVRASCWRPASPRSRRSRRSCPSTPASSGSAGSGGLFAAYSVVCLVLRIAGARLPERLGARRSVTIAFATLARRARRSRRVPRAPGRCGRRRS